MGGPESNHEEAEDVFFVTAAQLVKQDEDSAYDVYDAHECSPASPCPATAAAVPPACTNEASCKPPPEAQPSIYGLPSSATSLGGLGNFAPPPLAKPAVKKKLAKCAKGKVRDKHGQCVKEKKSKKKAKRAGRKRRAGS
jgi:hypothetical protein